MKPYRKRTQREPTIALINVVFLMLVFFLIAGTVAPPLDPKLTLVRTRELNGAAPPDGLVMHTDGRIEANGQMISSVTAYLSALAPDDRDRIRVIPDRNLPAHDLLRVASKLREAGAKDVVIATEKVTE